MIDSVKKIIKYCFKIIHIDIRRIPEYEKNKFVWLKDLGINTIIDIGANIGQFAQMIHKVLPTASIFSFEPIDDCYQKLIKNMADVPNFYAFNYALGDTDTDMEMHVNDFTASSSLLPMMDLHKQCFPYTAHECIKKVKVKQLDVAARGLDFDGNLLVKIDVQGYEDKVIRGGQRVLSQAKVLIVETTFERLYDGQPLFKDVYDLLSNMGFSYMGNFQQMKSPLDGGVLQADSIFVKERNK